MVLHGGAGDFSNKASKTTVKHKSSTPATAALSAGLREAKQQREQAKKATDPFDDLDSDEESDPLCAACVGGKPAAVRRALNEGADISVIGSEGMTPLFIVSQDGYCRCSCVDQPFPHAIFNNRVDLDYTATGITSRSLCYSFHIILRIGSRSHQYTTVRLLRLSRNSLFLRRRIRSWLF